MSKPKILQSIADIYQNFLRKSGGTITGSTTMDTESTLDFVSRPSGYSPSIRYKNTDGQFVTGLSKNNTDDIIIGSGVISGDNTKEIRISKNGDYIKLNGTDPVALVKDVAQPSNPNLIINGDFQVWQDGDGKFTSSGGYTADMWVFYTEGGAEGYVERAGKGTVDNHLKLVITKCGGTSNVRYVFEKDLCRQLHGKTVTVTMELSATQDVSLLLVGFYGCSSPNKQFTVKGDGTIQKFTFTWTFNYTEQSANPHMQFIRIVSSGWTGEIGLHKVKMEVGSFATPFSPRTYEEELAMCQRYFEKGDSVTVPSFIYTNGRNGIQGSNFCVEKRVKPTVKIRTSSLSATPNVNGLVSDGYSGSNVGKNVTINPNSLTTTGFGAVVSEDPLPTSDKNIYSYSWMADARLY